MHITARQLQINEIRDVCIVLAILIRGLNHRAGKYQRFTQIGLAGANGITGQALDLIFFPPRKSKAEGIGDQAGQHRIKGTRTNHSEYAWADKVKANQYIHGDKY